MVEFVAQFWGRLLLTSGIIGVGFALEELSRRRRPLPTSLASNLGFTAIYFTAVLIIARGLAFGGVAAFVMSLPGAGLIAVPLVPAVILWFITKDFFYYWFHRWQHTSAWLWAQHEIHHSDEHVNVTTTFRHHWLEFPLATVCVIAPTNYLIAMPLSAAVLLPLGLEAIGAFIHLDTDVRFARLSRWIATPDLHRIHHSTALEHRDKNFAVIFPVWDRLFGTYYAPGEERPATGVEGVTMTPLQGIVWPFRRWRGLLRGE